LRTTGACVCGGLRRAHNLRVAYDEELTDRIREMLVLEPDVVEKRMFGGIAFLIGGHIAVGVSNTGGLLMRSEHEDTDALLRLPHVEPFVMRGKAMRGWVRVGAEAVDEDDELRRWVESGVGYARSLPPS
jgi:TfoX/Sxy family transcriptional regulator of competence genes